MKKDLDKIKEKVSGMKGSDKKSQIMKDIEVKSKSKTVNK